MDFQTCLIHLGGNRKHPLLSNSNKYYDGMVYRAIWVDGICLQVQGRLNFKEYYLYEGAISFFREKPQLMARKPLSLFKGCH